MKYLILIFLFTFNSSVSANETCSRVATINYQEFLVDSSTTKKGEGLRYYLEKDPTAKMYLEKYQEGTNIRWQNAVLGSLGSGATLSSIFMEKGKKRDIVLISGITMLAINFLVSNTLDHFNEQNLHQAINEYNQRNLPKILFKTDANDDKKQSNYDISVEKNWGF